MTSPDSRRNPAVQPGSFLENFVSRLDPEHPIHDFVNEQHAAGNGANEWGLYADGDRLVDTFHDPTLAEIAAWDNMDATDAAPGTYSVRPLEPGADHAVPSAQRLARVAFATATSPTGDHGGDPAGPAPAAKAALAPALWQPSGTGRAR